jgi:uncharacterized membrane protein (UPF0127 family)
MTTTKRYKLLFVIGLSLLAVWLAPVPEADSRQQPAVSYAKGVVALPSVPPVEIKVDVALDGAAWQQGMMFRKDWGDVEGMLFVFPDEDLRSFWMQNTYLPLDIIYIDTQWRIVHIVYDAKPLDTTPLPSRKPAMAVLEIPAGKAKQYGLSEGDVLEWR